VTNHIGIGVVLRRGGDVLLGIRKNSHGAGRYSFPGGGVEGSETFAECAARETREETRIVIAPESFTAWTFTDDPFPEAGKRFATLYFVADAPESARLLERTGSDGTVFIPGAEPLKCERWEWHPWSRLPAPLFGGLATIRHLALPARPTDSIQTRTT
jgi:8-oxo-dGTP diphosphatase